jgi:predicted lipoprotein with Yx(FWY)xxD motif
MRSKYPLFALLAILAIITSACGSRAPAYQSPPGGGPVVASVDTSTPTTEAMAFTQVPVAQVTASATPSESGAINVSQNDQLGSFLVDDQGMTLYIYKRNTPNASNCNDNCAATWPPLLTTGNAVAGAGTGAGEAASMLGSVTRMDGTMQVTYNGWPLYHYSEDLKPGDTMGLGVGSVWYMISPTGDTLK